MKSGQATTTTRASRQPRPADADTQQASSVSGASPGASTAVSIMVHMLENCFHEQLVGHWEPKLKEMIPSYGHDLKTDAVLSARVRAETAEVLKLRTV